MKIQAISDIHGQLPTEACPECDILIIAGDICPDYSATPRDSWKQRDWLEQHLGPWLDKQPADRILATWGNHDFYGQRATYLPKLNWELLVNESIEIDGKLFYFTPYTPNLPEWAFSFNHDVPWSYRRKIPMETNILVSHGPPLNSCDKVGEYEHVGSDTLLARCVEIEPEIVICGHIHEARGEKVASWGGKIVNVASLDRSYTPYPTRFTEITI